MSSLSNAKQKGVADWIGPQHGDPAPIIYFSGIPRSAQTTEEEFLRIGVKHRCLSYTYVGNQEGCLYSQANFDALNFCLDNGVRVFLDSGAHTFQNIVYGKKKYNGANQVLAAASVEQLVAKYCQHYAGFVKDYAQKGKQFDFHVTFDYVHECKTIYKVTQALWKLGIKPVPVYHGDDGMHWLERYRDAGHKLIGISWSNATRGGAHRQQYYDRVFSWGAKNGVQFHGFAQTGRAMFAFPWYSVDSSSWLKVAAYGAIVTTAPSSNGRLRLRVVRVSDVASASDSVLNIKSLAPSVYKWLESFVVAKGFDLETLQTSLAQRGLFNAKTFLDISQGYKVKHSNWERLL